MVRTWYAYGTHLVRIWYAYRTHGTHTVRYAYSNTRWNLWYAYGTRNYSSDTHMVRIRADSEASSSDTPMCRARPGWAGRPGLRPVVARTRPGRARPGLAQEIAVSSGSAPPPSPHPPVSPLPIWGGPGYCGVFAECGHVGVAGAVLLPAGAGVGGGHGPHVHPVRLQVLHDRGGGGGGRGGLARPGRTRAGQRRVRSADTCRSRQGRARPGWAGARAAPCWGEGAAQANAPTWRERGGGGGICVPGGRPWAVRLAVRLGRARFSSGGARMRRAQPGRGRVGQAGR